MMVIDQSLTPAAGDLKDWGKTTGMARWQHH